MSGDIKTIAEFVALQEKAENLGAEVVLYSTTEVTIRFSGDDVTPPVLTSLRELSVFISGAQAGRRVPPA